MQEEFFLEQEGFFFLMCLDLRFVQSCWLNTRGVTQALAKLKEVGEEITEVLKMFPEEAKTESVPVSAEELRPSLVEQVQIISM